MARNSRGGEAVGGLRMRRLLLPAVIAAALVAAGPGSAVAEDGLRDAGSVETEKVVVGELLPDLRVPTLDRKSAVSLSSFRGKKLLLIEFASW